MLSLGGFGDLAAALAVFFASHSLPALPGLRGGAVRAMGERGYLMLHSLVGTVTLAWLIVATVRAPRVELWGFHPWTRWVPLLVMPLACMLLAAGLTTPNPFSLGPGGRGFDPARPGVVAITRHPVLWAAALWSGAHLFPNGELRAALLFGALLGFSLMGTRLFDRRRRAVLAKLGGATSNLPFAALLSGRAHWGVSSGAILRAVSGLALFVALLLAHGALLGVSPLDVLD